MRSPITKDGYKRLKLEIVELKTVRRPSISKAIGIAREHGDIKENAEYHAAKEEQSFVEARIKELESITATANVIDVTKIQNNKVLFGTNVIILNIDTDEESTYQIVSEYEANLELGLISNVSPIGKSLIVKEKGDEIRVIAPSGDKFYEILSIFVNELQ